MTRGKPHLRGERNGQAKLADTAVTEMRSLHAAGVSANQLARERNVSQSTAWRAIHRHTWHHVQ